MELPERNRGQSGATEDPIVTVARLMDQNIALLYAVEAALLFHSGSPWTGEMQTRWWNLTQHSDATTKVLCDVLRAAKAKVVPVPEAI